VRFLSRLRLTIDGEAPLLLAARKVEYFSAAFFLRNRPGERLPQDALLIARERFVGAGMEERLRVRNETAAPVSFELGLEVGADFADLFAVKDRDFALGRPDGARPLPPPAAPDEDGDPAQLVFRDPDAPGYATQVLFSQPGTRDGDRVRFRVELEPRGEWRLQLNVHPSAPGGDGRLPRAAEVERRFGDELARSRDSLAAWQLRMPRLVASWQPLQRTFERSLDDLASLRLRRRELVRDLPAAGMPWFMTLFGRDTIITCLQTMILGPDLARSALHALARLQAPADDPELDAEPGKIIHELRVGKAGSSWFHRYYGSVDATPLYLVLLSELWRWTGDILGVRDLKEPALRALAWIDEHGDRDGDGFVEYERRTERGLRNQSWKDSDGSQRFADGRLAETPIAPCEVQGYVYDAKLRTAELAREVWRDRPLAERLEREAAELRRRFDEAFWIEARGGYYALALDRDKRPVDSLCSNVGHLLWSGIVPEARTQAIVDQLLGEALWSGWGVRTMSSADGAYNPLSYHNGSVWPHDNSLVAAGLARYGRWEELQLVARRTIEAAEQFDFQLPEVFAGLRRTDAPFPVPYPTPGRPQAWAAATPILLLQLLLGLVPDPSLQTLASAAPERLPTWVGELELRGVRAFGRDWDVGVEGGAVRIEERA